MTQQSQVRRQTLLLCQQINEKCQIDPSTFSYDVLKHKEWYIQVLEILCPYLVDQLASAHHQENEGKAIDMILQIVNTLDEFNQDVTEAIKGKNIVAGDSVQIYYIVQVFAALLEEAIRQNQYESEAEQNTNVKKEFDQPSEDHFNFPSESIKKNGIKSYNSNRQQKSGHHSVIGIRNQFEKQEQSNDGQSQFNQYHQQPQPEYQKNQEIFQKEQNFNPNQQESSEYQSSPQYLEQKLSETKMRKKLAKTGAKNPEHNRVLFGQKKSKKLVQHPKMPRTLKKAKSAEAIKLTNQIRQDIKSSSKKIPTKVQSKIQSPVTNTIKKKQRQLQYHTNQFETHKKNMKQNNKKNLKRGVRTDANLHKILNWREEKLKEEQKQYEISLKNKLQAKKQMYVNKINKLLLEMEKKKGIQEKKQFREKLTKENERAVLRMAALEQWYQDRLAILKQNNQTNKKERYMVETGHKEIITQIQKQLKKENEEKLMKITQKHRQQSNFLDTDLEQLEKKIIQVYKKY